MSVKQQTRPPVPPFTLETAKEKVRLAEDGWNTRDAAKVALAYSLDTKWRNRAEFANRWEFGEDGLMQLRFACINDLPIKESERKFHWPLGRRPDDHPGLSELGL